VGGEGGADVGRPPRVDAAGFCDGDGGAGRSDGVEDTGLKGAVEQRECVRPSDPFLDGLLRRRDRPQSPLEFLVVHLIPPIRARSRYGRRATGDAEDVAHGRQILGHRVREGQPPGLRRFPVPGS
jgi:hypothetical protein